MKFVINPDENGNCEGKYDRSEANIPDGWEDIVEVDDLNDYEVVEWRYDA